MGSYSTISPKNLQLVDQNHEIILDVRTKMEHAEKYIGLGHANVPLDELNPTDFMMRHGLDRDATVYLLCRSGKRAALAAEKFIAEGYKNVQVIEGGINACEDWGYEIKGDNAKSSVADLKTKVPLTLERQVRIAVGMLTAFGAILGLLVHPYLTIIPLITGIGLIVAGITDRCGLALLLTKAPWNRERGKSCATSCCLVSKTGHHEGSSRSVSEKKVGQSCQ